jgi:SpoVK/Ycf46/Vps4 family AAA+-type ATPase
MRKAFSRIESINRCVCWIDEIEKAFPGKDSGGGDSGTSKRMLGMMLTFMQERKGEGYFVATANSIANVPYELLRAGRFDSIWFIDLPTREQRHQIIQIHLKKRGRDWGSTPGLDDIVSETDGYSGAELEQAVINGLRIAFYKKRGVDSLALYDDIVEAVMKMRPLSKTMSEDIEQLRSWAKDRAQMASKPQKQKQSMQTARRI